MPFAERRGPLGQRRAAHRCHSGRRVAHPRCPHCLHPLPAQHLAGTHEDWAQSTRLVPHVLLVALGPQLAALLAPLHAPRDDLTSADRSIGRCSRSSRMMRRRRHSLTIQQQKECSTKNTNALNTNILRQEQQLASVRKLLSREPTRRRMPAPVPPSRGSASAERCRHRHRNATGKLPN